MMAAGSETTSSALSWAMYLLAQNPSIQEQLRNEIRSGLPSPSSGETITSAQVDSLPLLSAVCSEVLRLYPSVPVTIRFTVKETQLGQHLLPKYSIILLTPWAINRSKHFWGSTAETFDPSRWINPDGTANKTGGASSNYAQLTFLHGPRSCIGQGFAQSELRCLLAAVAGRWQWSLAEGKEGVQPAGIVTTKPKGGMWLKMKPIVAEATVLRFSLRRTRQSSIPEDRFALPVSTLILFSSQILGVRFLQLVVMTSRASREAIQALSVEADSERMEAHCGIRRMKAVPRDFLKMPAFSSSCLRRKHKSATISVSTTAARRTSTTSRSLPRPGSTSTCRPRTRQTRD
ncbi:hypothetical protein MRB53_042128 [Persea americana]|nr:hypothetical protein MRB53_042128 [Persea americana]